MSELVAIEFLLNSSLLDIGLMRFLVRVPCYAWYGCASVCVVVIVDPGIANQDGYAAWDDGKQQDVFIKVHVLVLNL